ncbi:MAG: hypothetical protein ACT4QB_24125 [Gammaproteobacteria bacterium]
MNTPDIVINVACSVAGAIIYALGSWFIRYRAEQRGAYTGTWRGETFDESGTVEKTDEYQFRHRGDLIQGDIRRLSPQDQAHRRWKMYGRLRGRDFFAIFWSTDQNVLSYGSWYLHQTGDFEFDGYYLRVIEGKAGIGVKPIRLRIRKRQPKAETIASQPG